MTEGLREFDDSRGRCHHCGKLVFKGETWVIAQYTHSIAHYECDMEYKYKASLI